LGAHDANDATAEVFLVAWRRFEAVPDGDGTLPWLYGVARNVVRNQLRSRQRKIRLQSRLDSVAPASDRTTEALVVQSSEAAEVQEAIASLRPAEQEVLRLKTWEELSNESVGEILGLSPRAVEGRYARALKKLGRRLPNQGVSRSQAVREGGDQ
jgi:RNA polymerase sigma-70 factor (ECF subfamily)